MTRPCRVAVLSRALRITARVIGNALCTHLGKGQATALAVCKHLACQESHQACLLYLSVSCTPNPHSDSIPDACRAVRKYMSLSYGLTDMRVKARVSTGCVSESWPSRANFACRKALVVRRVRTSSTSATCAILAGSRGCHHLIHAASNALIAVGLRIHSTDRIVLQPTATAVDCNEPERCVRLDQVVEKEGRLIFDSLHGCKDIGTL